MPSNCLEMKFLVLCVTLNLLFFANFSSAEVTVSAAYDIEKTHTKKYEIKQSLQLLCNITLTEPHKNLNVDLKWEKDNTPVTSIDALKNRLSLSHVDKSYKLMLISAEQNDGGNYSCVAYDTSDNSEVGRANITVESKIYVKLARDTPVVEGHELKVQCKVYGSPTPQIIWEYKNVLYNHSQGRVILKDNDDGVPNAAFIIEEIVMEDQGELTCSGVSLNSNDTSKPAATTVRVKDKYAALWPFLGICAEVLVLCAIIFIYEKKRNKSELEESDTDQSPEQKNTPDHGGKESNLRHRQ